MKELYEKNKKLFVGILTTVCLVICVGVIGGALLLGNDKEAAQAKEAKSTVAKADVSKVKDTEEEEEEETEAEPEEATPEAVVEEVTQEAAEVVEDSILDVVETPNPQEGQPTETPKAEATAAPAAAPGTDLSNMAQNAEFPFEIRVNKQMNCVTVYAMDNAGAYSIPYKAMVCSTGNATPLGTFKTPAKYIWKILKGNVWGQYSTRITGSILFHSVPYRTSNKDALISKYYNKLGTTASAGCIRLTTIDAKWIYDNCPLGTTVVIYNDSNPGPLGKPTAMKVSESNKWDPTDPDPANPWAGKVLRIDGVQPSYLIERGYGIDVMSGVVATDANGNNVTGSVQVSTNADIYSVGIYGIHYVVTDALGNMATADATLQVVDTQAPVFANVPARIEGRRTSDINRDLLLYNVSVTDNGQGFDMNQVGVSIPNLVDGDNVITYWATDASGNTGYAFTTVVCDSTPPVITKKSGVSSYLALNQTMDANAAAARIQVQDAHPTNISSTITATDWGYKIDYAVNDSYGNVAYFTDQVSYVTYELVGSANVTVSKEGDWASHVQLKDSEGRTVSLPSDVNVSAVKIQDNIYKVTYQYTYQSPLGSRTTTFEQTAHVQ